MYHATLVLEVVLLSLCLNSSIFKFCSALHVVKFAISGVLATGVAVGTALFYAGRDEQIRDEVEKVPFAKEVLSSIYGEKKNKQDPGFTSAATDIGKKEDPRPLLKPLTVCIFELLVINIGAFLISLLIALF